MLSPCLLSFFCLVFYCCFCCPFFTLLFDLLEKGKAIKFGRYPPPPPTWTFGILHGHRGDEILKCFPVRYEPGKARMALIPQFFYFAGDCSSKEAQDQIKLNFVTLLNQQFIPSALCRDHADCNVGNVNVFCGATSSARRRRRKSANDVYVKVDIVAQEKQSGASKTVTQLEQILENDAKPLLDQQAKSLDWSPLRSSSDLEYQTYSITNAEAYCSDTGAVVGRCDTLETGCDGLAKPHSMCQCNKDTGAIERCSKW